MEVVDIITKNKLGQHMSKDVLNLVNRGVLVMSFGVDIDWYLKPCLRL